MCYSAQILADYRRYVRMFGAHMDIAEFARLYFLQAEGRSVKTPKALDDAFRDPQNDGEREIWQLIEKTRTEQKTKLEQDLFKQRTRLTEAERKLEAKVTKAATESRRIATDKIEAVLRRIEDVNRTESKPWDSRIFPGTYAPVLVMENGEYVVRPMRYQCRIAGKPANYDVKFPGTYNARLDNLEGFWKPCFGHTHGAMLVEVFYENVKKAKMEGTVLETHEKDENVVLEFRPSNRQLMHVACLWSRWTKPGEPDLLSFAAITDDPPPEIEAVGHERCIIPIKPENIETWLNPTVSSLDAMYAILDDKDRPYYEHRLAA
ncbi:putative SOS response-associated peptidase YedK [Paraburkholderia sp. BL27I4N3]|uniref:SOS response-associated peptidase family protein n=1 Tax=Paraburkholderia sp. BL27I4N3 TaxID=1938805 RepID=UPI000E2815BD|nr:SOS response-associated peptidase family protein [Paraburkholderia sp. BL27I4N3]REE17746.1 putative SOS response-associated peptidase YedK [Paraburkholderia sp. BL27I4N3]